MTDDAADDDDERLKSLRAVWLAMPDEDPPERGLSDLMAAARMKANEMSAKAEPAAPSLWQRFLELMRRPPVLALATVTVLIGGAALVSRRSDKMESAPTVSQTQAPSESVPAAAPALERADNHAAPTPDPTVTATAAQGSAMEMAPAGGDEGGEGETTHGAVGGADVERKAPLKKADAAKSGGKQALQTKQALPEKEPARRAPPADEPAKAAIEQQTETLDDADVAKDATTKQTRGATPPPKEESKVSGASAVPTISNDTSSGPAVTELHKTARDAAARGDCEVVKRAVRKIAVKDARYYDLKVANDPALATCFKR